MHRSTGRAEPSARSRVIRLADAAPANATVGARSGQADDDGRPSFTKAAGYVLLMHALLAALFALLLAATPELRTRFDATQLKSAALGVLLMQGGFILLPTLLVILLLRLQPQQIAGDKPRIGSLLLAGLVGIPAAVVLSGVNNLLLFLLSSYGIRLQNGQPGAFALDPGMRSPAELALIAIVTILLPAVIEELMFRGLIQGSLMARTSEGTAIFLQALAFMAFHTDPAFILPPFLAGLLLGLIRSRTGSLVPAIMAHLSLNASLALLTTYLPRFTQQLLEITTQSSRTLLYALLMASCLAGVALVPLVILIAGSPPYRHRRRSRWFSADARFMLATLLLLATIIFSYFNP